MESQKINQYTIKDIYNLPEGKRAELINGYLEMMAPPSRIHQEILNYLSTEINLYIRSKTGECKVYPAPFAVFLNADEKTYVEPDISVICDKSKLTDQGCSGAPDWVIEIVSPSSRTKDYYIKLGEYCMSGVREYWIVDPDRKIVLVYNIADGESPVIYKFTDKITSSVMAGLEIDFTCLEK